MKKLRNWKKVLITKSRYNKIKTTLFIFLMKFYGILNLRDPEMCNEPQKCRCLLRCCWKIYPRSFLIAWKISWSCYFKTAKSGCREKTIGTACGGKWHDIVYEWNIKRTRAYKAWQPPPPLPRILKCASVHVDV